MATYVIGDVQGCFQSLQQLLTALDFDPGHDKLWFVGDVVNRGPSSLQVLRFIKQLDSAVVVLGNHELHMLAVAFGVANPRPADTFQDILHAPDRDELLNWLKSWPLIYRDHATDWTMVHAGLPPQWSIAEAEQLAQEVEQCLQKPGGGGFFQRMYGNQPDRWDPGLQGWDRLRFIVNCLTRIRIVGDDGRINLDYKGPPNDNQQPWFKAPSRVSADDKIVFGHWSTLGLYVGDNVVCVDTGCLWGGSLTAICLEDPAKMVQVPCQAWQPIL